uniref:Slc25a-11 n=1 Tax=Schmidtea mediterranea TaxID=79327 RepID=A0A0H3YJC1_SCHMD|nr:slc25a-11 [Schmidtea mediterranea]
MFKDQEKKYVLNDFLCGGAAAMINICILYPFYKTIFFQQLDNLTWNQAALRLLKEGPNNIYRGLLPPLIQTSATRSIMFGGYGKTKLTLDNNEFINLTIIKVFISAISAGILEAMMMPFERVQVLLQNKMYNDKFKHTYHTFKVLASNHGFKELYRGFRVVLIRNCIGNTIYFNACDRFIYESKLVFKHNSVSYHFNNFIIGGILGACISLLIYPFNVVKTRQQSSIGGTFQSGITVVGKIYSERGKSITQLYRGSPANCVRSLVSWGIITMANEFLRDSKIFLYY